MKVYFLRRLILELEEMYVVSSGSDDLCAYVVAEFREYGNCVTLARVDRKWTG